MWFLSQLLQVLRALRRERDHITHIFLPSSPSFLILSLTLQMVVQVSSINSDKFSDWRRKLFHEVFVDGIFIFRQKEAPDKFFPGRVDLEAGRSKRVVLRYQEIVQQSFSLGTFMAEWTNSGRRETANQEIPGLSPGSNDMLRETSKKGIRVNFCGGQCPEIFSRKT
ncbi:hypothetical protein BCR42DRAFT_397185 [Absidia repens]|uniref:Uncharacterized protein n=1 Tax=Absidia repens TaxID=90262 RepID=A0A1X2I269_9FUNG|nr:hypothetical protein BCR42DRAFT_397185 [Absidia repens]